ncbi:MAG: hypothetical protein ABL999_01750 [Pyrinomonadaceae bacterium]
MKITILKTAARVSKGRGLFRDWRVSILLALARVDTERGQDAHPPVERF